MNILMTGGSGDLARVLTHKLKTQHEIFRLDIKPPLDNNGTYIQCSITDKVGLNKAIKKNIHCIVHIAAWHGIHEFTQEKNADDFWDLNVNGTYNVFQTAAENNINNIVFISSESISDQYSLYGSSEIFAEKIAETYAHRHKKNIITLRPRGFIPHWNKQIYKTYIDWAKWYCQGCVHITDFTQAVINSIELLNKTESFNYIALPVDGAYEYNQKDLDHWDQAGKHSSFKKYYEKHYALAIKHGLDPSIKPTIQDISETKKILNYSPEFSLKNLLEELEMYGDQGPPMLLT